MGDCRATLRYLKDLPLYQTVKPYVMKRKPPPGVPRSNFKGVDCTKIKILDVRNRENDFTLAENGFAFGKLESKQPLETAAGISAYLEEVREFLSKALNCEDVRIFEHKLRDSSVQRDRDHDTSVRQASSQYRRPSGAVHVDQTPDAAEHRIRTHFPQDCGELLRRRYRFVNVWRPLLDGPVHDCPLALCDSRSISSDDLVECDLVYDHYEGEHFKVKFNKNHEWYYYSLQRNNEVTMILNFDSHSDTRCAHVAFKHPMSPEGAEPRRSIEVRAAVFSLE